MVVCLRGGLPTQACVLDKVESGGIEAVAQTGGEIPATPAQESRIVGGLRGKPADREAHYGLSGAGGGEGRQHEGMHEFHISPRTDVLRAAVAGPTHQAGQAPGFAAGIRIFQIGPFFSGMHWRTRKRVSRSKGAPR